MLIAVAAALAAFLDDEDEEETMEIEALTDAVAAVRRLKRTVDAEDASDSTTAASKRSRKDCDYERARHCVHQDCIGPDPLFHNPMNKTDARRVAAMHHEEFGVDGCVGCLDCMHVYWRTCPAAWQGQHDGKEGNCSIALEASSDYNAWFWHSFFGPPGTLNDINIWDKSPLLRSFLDGSFDQNDFEFTVGGQKFDKLHFLVDGVYPELSRFMKTISEPLTKRQQQCSGWQEGKRKSIERAHGMLQRKFQCLCKPVELWCENEIKAMVETCLILHNMMVEERIMTDVNESDFSYDFVALDENDNRDALMHRERNNDNATASSTTNDRLVGDDGNDRRRTAATTWLAGASDDRADEVQEALVRRFADAQTRWDSLCDSKAHYKLKCAAVEQVHQNSQKKDEDDNN